MGSREGKHGVFLPFAGERHKVGAMNTWGILARLYGGLFVVDLRLTLLCSMASLLLSAGTLLPIRSIRTAPRMVWLVLAVWVGYFFLSVLILDLVFQYPVFRIRAWFPIP